MKESFVLYTDMEEQLGMLDNAEAGKLMKAIFAYMRSGEAEAELTGATKMAFLFIRKTLDRDGEKYEQMKEGRIRAGRASAEARKRKKEEVEQEAEGQPKGVSMEEQKETGVASVPTKRTDASSEEQKGTKGNSVQQRETNPTVSVPDPVPVSVPVPEKKKKAFGRYKNIFLTQEELLELQREFPVDYQRRIERLSEYMASTGKSYASPLAAIRYWAKNGKEKPNGTLKQPDPAYGWQFGTVL